MAWCHLHGKQYAGMSVLINIAALIVVFSNHAGNISHTSYLAGSWVGEDYLVGNLLFCILYGFYVYRNLLIVIADTATCGDKALCLQTRKKQLLTNTVCLQTLAVDV